MQTINGLNQLLAKSDLIKLLDLIHASLYCADENDLRKLMYKLREIVPHNFAISGIAQIGEQGSLDSYKSLNVDYPEEWIRLYIDQRYNECDPVFITNFVKIGLQQWSKTYKLKPPSRKFLSEANQFGLIRGYTFGARSRSEGENIHSLISFSGKSIEENERTEVILQYFLPHLHEALVQIKQSVREMKQPASLISPREKEVLHLLKDGKNSWAVSTILNISERTVNFHVGNIMQKLGAESRLHAVAIAARMKVIDLD